MGNLCPRSGQMVGGGEPSPPRKVKTGHGNPALDTTDENFTSTQDTSDLHIVAKKCMTGDAREAVPDNQGSARMEEETSIQQGPPDLPPRPDNQRPARIKDEAPTPQDPMVESEYHVPTEYVEFDTKEDVMKGAYENPVSSKTKEILPTTQETTRAVELVALYDHTATYEEDLSFNKGDALWLLSADNSGDNWCRVVKTSDKTSGYVPWNYVARKGDLSAKSWYHGDISGVTAASIVQHSDRKTGDFLVRKSDERKNEHTLTLLWCDEGGVRQPKHYRILTDDADSRVYLTRDLTFSCLADLIDYYIGTKGQLCCHLRSACLKPKPPLPDLPSKWKDEFKIPRNSITLKEVLGTGNYGVVRKGLWKNTLEVAVKEAKKGKLSKKTFLLEASIMKTLQHPNIVRLYGICLDDPVYIITELMEKGSLLDFLRDANGPGPTLSQEGLIDKAVQVARGMAYIEKKKLIHRDLSARNVLVGETFNVKIADFGLARAIQDDEYTATGGKFPVKWTAPEGLKHRKYSIKSDVWSFGILLVEIITHGGEPYIGYENKDIFPYLERGGRHLQPTECPDDLFEIMTSCWAKLPNARPDFADLVEDLLLVSPTGQPPVRPGSRNPDGESGTVIYESLDDAPAIPRVAAEFKRSDKEDPETSRRSVKNITQEKKILVAQSDFQSDAANSISFIKGDRFERLSSGPWPLVVHMTTGQRGYVPADNVAEEDTSDTPVVPLLGHLTPGQKGDVPENFVAEVGFQPDVNLSTAEDMLMAEGNGQGVFLIRGAFAPTKQEPLVLAVLCQGKENTRIVKNHRLKVDHSGHYFIDEKSKFETLHQLVTHYKGNPDLGCVLTRPCQCPVVQDLSSQKQDSFEIPRRFLEKGERIGNGNFCYVHKGLWYGHFPVAIKCAKPKSMSAAQLLEEAAAMEPLKHKNLVRLYGICSDEPIFIVTELVPFGDLRSYMISETDKGRKLKFVDRLEVAQQVVQAMTYLESKRFVHRDLAARNILVGANRVMKVADFGLARSLVADTYVAHGRTFPLKWTALEAILFAKFSSKSDVWSFGILLVEIVTDGEEPYPGLTREDVTHKLKQGNRHPQPEGCPADLYEIMFTCWDKEPAERPTFAEIQPMLDELIADCRK